jgi:tRNA(Ile)-lysidine synthase
MSPLTVAELAAALEAIGGFEHRPQIAVAVSGGPDSLALVILADRWARQRGGETRALTVDHGLRTESAEEARTVTGWLAARGIAHETLVWPGAKPASGVQEAAREARYRLLEEWCRTRGVLHLLTAHHREDQGETYLIRRRAGSRSDGLAGMSAVRELAGCRLIRPLLSVPRARLLALLAREGQPFLRDPSNLNPAFERARLRAAVTSVDDDLPEIQAHGRRRSEREAALDQALARAVSLHPAGFAALDPAALCDIEAEAAERLLGRIAACIGAAQYPARRERLARLRASLTARPDRARTLGGCRFVPWRGRFLVLRELAAACPPARLEPGDAFLWDQRFAVVLPPTAQQGFWFGYLGQSGGAVVTEPRTGDLPRLTHPVLPALWDAAGLATVPHLGYLRAGLAASSLIFFRAARALTQAGFTVV